MNVTASAETARKLRILHTVRSLRVDGVGKVILRNLANRDAERFDHHLCSLRGEDDLAGEAREIGINPVFLAHSGIRSIPRTVRRLVRLIRDLQIDIVHVNRTVDLALAGFAARMCGIPVVSTIHWLGRLEDHPEDEGKSPRLARWLEMTATVMLNRALASRIIAVSRAVEASYASLAGFPADRVQVVSPRIDMERAPALRPEDRDSLKAELGLASAKPVLLNVGRLDTVKGQRHLVPMMRQIRQQRPQAKLLIAGEGELRAALTSAIAAEGLQDAVVLLGQRSDVDQLLELSDLLILSSESEAAPLPLFEAMRAGKPVVATAVGGVAEIVQHGITGLIVPRGDSGAMAEAVLSLLSRPEELKRMGEAARRLGRERFDVAISVRALEDLYRSLLGRSAA